MSGGLGLVWGIWDGKGYGVGDICWDDYGFVVGKNGLVKRYDFVVFVDGFDGVSVINVVWFFFEWFYGFVVIIV